MIWSYTSIQYNDLNNISIIISYYDIDWSLRMEYIEQEYDFVKGCWIAFMSLAMVVPFCSKSCVGINLTMSKAWGCLAAWSFTMFRYVSAYLRIPLSSKHSTMPKNCPHSLRPDSHQVWLEENHAIPRDRRRRGLKKDKNNWRRQVCQPKKIVLLGFLTDSLV